MDATTKQKTLSVFLVALLVGSVVLVAATAVASHAGDPTRQPNSPYARAIVDETVSHTRTIGGTATVVNNVTEPTGGLVFNTTYDFTITGLNGTASTQWNLFRPSGTGTWTQVGNPLTGYEDEAHLGKFNVTIFSQTFDAVGVWQLRNSGGTETVSFYVGPQTNLQVTVSSNVFTYTTGGQFVEITVTNLTPGSVGQLVGDVTLTGFNLASAGEKTGTTGAQLGKLLYTRALPGVGSYLIEAARDTNGDNLPEYYGNTTVTVVPASLLVTAVDTTVRSGFTENASWDIRYPNGTGVFAHAQGTNNLVFNYNWANLTVTLPNGDVQYVNSTVTGTSCGATTGFARTVSTVRTMVANAANGCGTATIGAWQFSEGGRFYYRPGTQWDAGTYRFNLAANVLVNVPAANTGADTPAEYVATEWTLTTVAPANVNLKLHNNSIGGDELRALRVQASSIGTSLGAYTGVLQIVGSASTEVPLTSGGSAFFTASNITVTGDVLPVSSSAITLGGNNGLATITFVPTRVGGTVNFNVNWKGVTTTISVPITEGADSSVDKTEVVVDQTSTVTVTVKDRFGNPFPGASVTLLTTSGTQNFAGVGNIVINGTGAPGLGQNGQYTFNVRPTETGNLVVYSTIGSIVNGVNNQNFSYALVRVVPAHDLSVTLSTNSTMAGNRTYVHVAATTAEGHGVTTAGNYRAYFLNATKLAELRSNGTSALTGITWPHTLTGTSQVNMETPSGESAQGVSLNVSLDPGTYYVYVCSNMTTSGGDCTTARHDNINNTPVFTSIPWNVVFSPDRIASNAQLQSNTVVTATVTDRNGVNAPTGSAIRVRSGSSAVTGLASSYTINGTGNFQFTVTGANVGDVVFEMDVSGTPTHYAALDTPFRVVGPNVQVTPDRVPLGRAATLVIAVKSLNGTALPNLSVQVCGTPIGGTESAPGCTGNVTTDAGGFATVGVNPSSTGNMTLRVSGINSNVNVTVFAGLDILLSRPTPQANDTQEVTVQVIGATGGEAGVVINVTRDGTAVSGFPQTTGSSGKVFITNLQEGNYTVTATKQGFDRATATFAVSAAPVVAPQPRAVFGLANLTTPASATVGQPISVMANVRNTGDADGTASVLLLVNGAVRDSRQVPVGAGGQETVAFDFTPNTAGSFTVTVKLASGETLDANTVTVTTPTTSTPVTSTPVTSTPVTSTPVTSTPVTSTPVTSTPVTSTPVTSTPAEPSPEVPGFEVVALFAALGVALLVLRRRS